MRRRLLGLCLLAFPREVRERDRDQLRDLALDLAESHGTAREAFGLLRGGLAERRRRAGRTRRALVTLGAVTGLILGSLTWAAAAEGGRVEEDLFSCAGECAEIEGEVATRVRDGWTCAERREPGAVTWRCSRD
jgi:hypothetical protein